MSFMSKVKNNKNSTIREITNDSNNDGNNSSANNYNYGMPPKSA